MPMSKSKARTHEINALKTLVNLTSTSNPETIPYDTLSLPLRYLRSDRIPKNSPHCPPEDPELINLAFKSLQLLPFYRELFQKNASLAGSFAGAWPSVWKWILWFYARAVAIAISSPGIASKYLDVIPQTLTSFAFIEDIRETLSSSPEVMSIIIRCWLREDESGSPFFKPDQPFTEVFAGLISVPSDPSTLEKTIMEAVDGDANIVARLAVKRLKAALSPPEPFERIRYHMSTLTILIGHALPRSSLRSALLLEGVIPVTLKTLGLSTSQTWSKVESHSCAISCLSILFAALQSVNGPSWIAQALDSGLLPHLLRSGPIIAPLLGNAAAPPIISDILIPSLVYRSLLRSVAKTLKEIERLGIGRKEAGPFWNEWVDFKNVATSRLETKKRFDENRANSGIRAERDCNNSNCSHDGATIEVVRRCSGCLGAMYCSTACQRADWKTHRSDCREMKQFLLEGMQAPLSSRDTDFIKYLAMADVSRPSPQLTAARNKFVPQPRVWYCVSVDYTTHPFSIKIADSTTLGIDKSICEDVMGLLRKIGETAVAVTGRVRQGENTTPVICDEVIFLPAIQEK